MVKIKVKDKIKVEIEVDTEVSHKVKSSHSYLAINFLIHINSPNPLYPRSIFSNIVLIPCSSVVLGDLLSLLCVLCF